MTALDPGNRPDDQSPAQWAVRWFAIAAVAVVCAAVPVVHILWHGVLARDEPLVRTRSQVVAPSPRWANLRSGEWMLAKQRELREASPLTWWLRGHWNELRYRLGIPQSESVHFGRDEWLFLASSVRPDRAAHLRASDARRRLFAEVRDTVRRAGAELLVTVIPDKARIYPDRAWPLGDVPAEREADYARILAELRSLDIASVDLAAPLRAHRENPVPGIPEGELYYARDTHWRPAGAMLAGLTTAAEIERRFGDRLGARRQVSITGPTVVRAIGDLTAQLGLLTAVEPDPIAEHRTIALSLLADRLAEVRDYYGVDLRGPGGDVGMFGKDPDAEILLIGTSFAQENGMNALALGLARSVRGTLTRGAEGLLSLREAMVELRAGTKAKVVVWEIVERGLFSADWLEPRI